MFVFDLLGIYNRDLFESPSYSQSSQWRERPPSLFGEAGHSTSVLRGRGWHQITARDEDRPVDFVCSCCSGWVPFFLWLSVPLFLEDCVLSLGTEPPSWCYFETWEGCVSALGRDNVLCGLPAVTAHWATYSCPTQPRPELLHYVLIKLVTSLCG